MRSGGLAATSSSSSTPPSSDKSYDKGGKKVKKYSSDGKPIYED
jgi:hypothetical protein